MRLMQTPPIGNRQPQKPVKARENRPLAGILMMCAAVLCFTAIDTSAKWLTLAGLSALQVVFARYFGHFALSLLVFLPTEGLQALRSRRPLLQFARSVVLLLSTVFNFTALTYLPITLTTTIFFAGPIVVSLLSIPILGEKVGIRRFMAVVVGFLGVLVVIQPWGAEFHPAMLLSIAAMICASFYFVLTRFLAGTESNATSQLWSSGVATVCLVPFIFADWRMPDSAAQIIVLSTIGAFGVLGHSLATVAHRLADASVLAPVVYLQILFATIAGILLFATWPTVWTLAGALIIIGAGFYIWRRERQLKKQAPPIVDI